MNNKSQKGLKLNWSLSFKLINSIAQFKELKDDRIVYTSLPTSQQYSSILFRKQKEKISKQQEIIIPKIQLIQKKIEPGSFIRKSKIPLGYIRSKPNLNLPKYDTYELTQVDVAFLQAHTNNYKINQKVVLTSQFLTYILIQLEKKVGRYLILDKSPRLLNRIIRMKNNFCTALSNYNDFLQKVYRYWRTRRLQLKFPLLRQYWSPAPEDYNFILAYKSRLHMKHQIRISKRVNYQKTSDQLLEQLNIAVEISKTIKYRQQIKLKQLQSQIGSFHNECSQFFKPSQFLEQLKSFKETIQPKPNLSQDLKLLRFNQQQQACNQLQQKKQQEPMEAFLINFAIFIANPWILQRFVLQKQAWNQQFNINLTKIRSLIKKYSDKQLFNLILDVFNKKKTHQLKTQPNENLTLILNQSTQTPPENPKDQNIEQLNIGHKTRYDLKRNHLDKLSKRK